MFDKDFTYREDKHALVECSTFADDWKYRGEAWQKFFHYINIPYIDDINSEEYDIQILSKNIVGGCNDIIAWLSGK